ncbi:MAG: serine/threonine protein phosphatase [Planctomycetota bacterium]|nr:MAG: serine/threonine protein phosphatase [Planctomycetota bacterium]
MKRYTAAPRTIALGDIHGCNVALATMVEGLRLQPDDALVVLGDVIDRGPDSRDVIRQLLALRGRCQLFCIQGNHEQMLLDALEGRMAVQEWLIHGGAETLDSYGKGAGMLALEAEHVDFLRTWGDVYETDTHFFVHGNYLATRPFGRQPWRDLRWQSLKWHTPEPHISGKTAVLGHTSNKQGKILNLGHLICLDTYCHGGYWLTALDATTGRVWQANQQGEFRNGELPPIQSASVVRRYP